MKCPECGTAAVFMGDSIRMPDGKERTIRACCNRECGYMWIMYAGMRYEVIENPLYHSVPSVKYIIKEAKELRKRFAK